MTDYAYQTCAGIDVHKRVLWVYLRRGRGKGELRSFGTTTTEIEKLAQWLLDQKCEMATMESTGPYWKPVWNIFEEIGVPQMLVNARDVKAVPGKKTDKKDAEWLAQLTAEGHVQPSFIPDRKHRELRDNLAYRVSLRQTRAAEINRVQKILEGANIKLSNHISDINGKSGRALIQELLDNGPPDEKRLIQMQQERLISTRLKASTAELSEALNGKLSDGQRRQLTNMLKHIDDLEDLIADTTELIDSMFSDKERAAIGLLGTIPGIAEDTAKTIIGVIGDDIGKWDTVEKFCRWTGVAPGNNESAGRQKSGRTTKGHKLLKRALVVAAHSAASSHNTFLAQRYQRLKVRIGAKKAAMAIAHSIVKAIFYMMRTGEAYTDLGPEHYFVQNNERRIAKCLRELQKRDFDPSTVDWDSDDWADLHTG